MPDCVVCHEETEEQFYPINRPADCVCAYKIHLACYNTWLETTNMEYNCIICLKRIEKIKIIADYFNFITIVYLILLYLFILKNFREFVIVFTLYCLYVYNAILQRAPVF